MLKFVKFTVKSLAVFAVVWFLFYYFYISGWNIDLGNKEEIRQWVGKEFKLKQSIFVFRYGDTGRYSASLPGHICMVPASIEDYQADPEIWQYTDGKAQKGWGRADGVIRGDCVYPVYANAHFTIKKIYYHRAPLVSDYLHIQVQVNDKTIRNLTIDMSHFFDVDHDRQIYDGGFKILGIKADVIEEIEQQAQVS